MTDSDDQTPKFTGASAAVLEGNVSPQKRASAKRKKSAPVGPLEAQFDKDPWMDKFRELKEYLAMNGDTLVPQQYPENKALGFWVHKQRTQYKLYKRKQAYTTLSEERIALLDEIGFDWDPIETNWMKRYGELEQFVIQTGSSLIARDSPKFPGLGEWVRTQRRQYALHMQNKRSSMTLERIEMLNKIEFEWNAREARWMAAYVELGEYVKVHGLGALPSSKENISNYKWILEQQRQYAKELQHPTPFQGKASALNQRRKELLDLLGFPWPEVEFRDNRKSSVAQTPKKRRKIIVFTDDNGTQRTRSTSIRADEVPSTTSGVAGPVGDMDSEEDDEERLLNAQQSGFLEDPPLGVTRENGDIWVAAEQADEEPEVDFPVHAPSQFAL